MCLPDLKSLERLVSIWYCRAEAMDAFKASIHLAGGRLTTRSHEVSKPRDSGLEISNRPDIWQAHRFVCQISERYEYYNIQSRFVVACISPGHICVCWQFCCCCCFNEDGHKHLRNAVSIAPQWRNALRSLHSVDDYTPRFFRSLQIYDGLLLWPI